MDSDSSPAAWEPVLGVCGWSGSGKTTLIEQVVPRLLARGLRVGVAKHDTHGITVDRPGKDSDRLYRAGADVALGAPRETLLRLHSEKDHGPFAAIQMLLAEHDLVLLEGYKGSDLPKVWLAKPGQPDPPSEVAGVMAVLPWDEARSEQLIALLNTWLPAIAKQRPRLGGVLVGGSSRRMGQAKQLVVWGGQTLAEMAAKALQPTVDRVVMLGSGETPQGCADFGRLADPPGVKGPLAGLLAALRWAPRATWFITACDLPMLGEEAVAWLESQRGPGRWAILPKLAKAGVEPLLAVYEPQSRPLLEQLANRLIWAPRHITRSPSVYCPQVPRHLVSAWTNVNTPDDLQRVLASP